MFAWQNIAVAGVLLGALAYAGAQAWRRLSSFKTRRKPAPNSCGDDCGCGGKS